MAASKQLQIPEIPLRDEKSYEIARVWVAEGAEHVSLLVGVWKDPAMWGIVLADLARHVVNAFDQEDQLNREKTMERIRTVFHEELNSPTDHPTGRVLKM